MLWWLTYCLCCQLDLPRWDIGCEAGTFIGIQKLGGASNVFPLGRSSATWESDRIRTGWYSFSKGHIEKSQKCKLSPLYISSYDPLICPRHGRKPTPADTNAHTLTHPPTQLPVVACSTYNRAKQTQTGGVALPSVSRALLPGRRQRYTQADGPVELAPPRLHRDHGAKVCLVAQQLCNQLIRNWLSLRSKRKWWRERGVRNTGTSLMVW